ncbi:MAG: DUF502 domain-containing protein [Gammaproteobacteria bacterium]|nr:DUF502 domain-containing protein [Gammaproteobacteria bacterium]
MKQKTVTSRFVKGLLFTLPIALTFVILAWVFNATEAMFGGPIKSLLPLGWYFPGLGIVVACVFIYLIGLAIDGRVLTMVVTWMEKLLARVPLVSSVYQNIKEMVEFMSGGRDDQLSRVVLVTLQDNVQLIGFVTQQDADIESDDELHAVFLPMSYQMGGYLLYLPESRLKTLDMTPREAMQKVLTAEISQG